MKKAINYILLIFCILNCSKQNNNNNNEENDKNKIIMNNSGQNNIYTLDVTTLCTFDLYINDIPAKINGIAGGYLIDINDYVLRNGKYKIKAIFYTNPDENVVINKTNFNLYSFYKDKGVKVDASLKKLQNLPIPDLTSTKPIIINKEWEVEITDLPYKLAGWENSRVFKDKDNVWLEPKVVEFYEKVRKVLNEGKGDDYIKLLENRNAEFKIFDFETDENIVKGNNAMKDRINKYASGNMVPLEDYTLKIYGQGRLVCLERNCNIKIKTSNNSYRTIKEINENTNSEKNLETRGWSPLILNSTKAVRRYTIYLHMPKGSEQFEIIR